MINKIRKIKNLGIFSDFTWNSEVPEFKRYNLIYGWTGSGKTTLSNLFSVFNSGQSPKYPNLEYEIETDSGNFTQGNSFPTNVRVFNQDYILNNISINEGKAKSISLILGDENIKLVEEIKNDEAILTEKQNTLKKITDDKQKQEESKSKLFTDIARTISSNTSGEAIRKYNKRNAEDAFRTIAEKTILNEPELNTHSLTLRQIEKPNINELVLGTLNNISLVEAISQIGNKIKDLLLQTVELIMIERLKQNSDISKWVEQGLHLHQEHQSAKCEFCGLDLSENRLKELTGYFNEADKKLKNEIDEEIVYLKNITSLIGNILPVDKANLYDEMQAEYLAIIQLFQTEKNTLLTRITDLVNILEYKKSKTTEPVTIDFNIDSTPFIDKINELNMIISNHNTKTNNFKAEKDTAQKQLEIHYLSTVYDEIKSLETKVTELEIETKNLKDSTSENPGDLGINQLITKITENKNRISSTHKACDEINKGLKTFLGRDELQFTVENDWYILKRRSGPAHNISEGEQTAIAFVYFTIHLKEIDVANSIIVIDDPISSLDSNSLFQAFAFLKTAVENAHQVFMLTHNFDFLRLLLDWIRYTHNTNSYMINNFYDNGIRRAKIQELDKTLREHQTEYHYLFKILYNFQSNGTIESVYHIPNIARKVLETFLMFRVPSNEIFYKRLKSLETVFDGSKLTAIYKFTNDQSHITGAGFDPSLISETQKNVTYLLELIQTTFPEHYAILIISIGGNLENIGVEDGG